MGASGDFSFWPFFFSFPFMGNLFFFSQLEGLLFFPLGWGSSERGGNVNVLFWASLYLPFFGGWLLLYISSVDDKGGFWWILKYGIEKCWWGTHDRRSVWVPT